MFKIKLVDLVGEIVVVWFIDAFMKVGGKWACLR
jgi:hypothetical protein